MMRTDFRKSAARRRLDQNTAFAHLARGANVVVNWQRAVGGAADSSEYRS
jgi:hypothetical protein